MLALLLVAVSLGLSNFAASVGLGASGVDRRTRLRVGLVFGFFETAMPIIGLLAGRGAAGALGHATRWLGAALLIATGVYSLVQALRSARDAASTGTPSSGPPSSGPQSAPPPSEPQRLGPLLVTGLALSLDNLAVGFALGAVHVSLPVAVIVIGAVSVTLSLLGLELGQRLSSQIGGRGEILGGLVLIGVGIAVAAGVL
jgi:manganese efflux pump family protein